MSVPESLVAGRYRLVEMVGSGGMGVVWRAWDERLQRQVAVKQLRPLIGLSDADTQLANDRAMREARITARLHHRHAVSVFDVVDDDGRPCLIMQFVACTTLAEELREHGPLPPARVAHLGTRIASALAAAHDLGIVHRDVKPGNVLLGEDGTTLISDFGISRALDDISLTSTGMVHGTPAYLAPEVARGDAATYASDVFSLGATLYAATEGAPPFGSDANSIALLHRVAAGTIEAPRQSGPLAPLLVQMLSADPSARPSMSRVASELETLARTADDADLPSLEPTRQLPATTTAGATRRTPAAPAAPVDRAPGRTPGAPASERAPAVVAARDARPDTFRMDPAPAPAVVPSGPGGLPAEEDPPAGGRRRRAGVVALLVTLVAVAALAFYLVPMLGGQDRGTVADAPVDPTASSAPEDSGNASPRDESTAPPADEPEDEEQEDEEQGGGGSSPETSPEPSEDSQGPPTEQELRAAITDYYSLVPDRLDEAWPLMTSSYQDERAGGRESYEEFWSDIERVETSDVTAEPPGQVDATLTYHFEDGRVLVEQTSFELVEEEGELKIDGSTVVAGR